MLGVSEANKKNFSMTDSYPVGFKKWRTDAKCRAGSCIVLRRFVLRTRRHSPHTHWIPTPTRKAWNPTTLGNTFRAEQKPVSKSREKKNKKSTISDRPTNSLRTTTRMKISPLQGTNIVRLFATRPLKPGQKQAGWSLPLSAWGSIVLNTVTNFLVFAVWFKGEDAETALVWVPFLPAIKAASNCTVKLRKLNAHSVFFF